MNELATGVGVPVYLATAPTDSGTGNPSAETTAEVLASITFGGQPNLGYWVGGYLMPGGDMVIQTNAADLIQLVQQLQQQQAQAAQEQLHQHIQSLYDSYNQQMQGIPGPSEPGEGLLDQIQEATESPYEPYNP